MLRDKKPRNYDFGGNRPRRIGRTVAVLGLGAVIGAGALETYDIFNPDPLDASSVSATFVQPQKADGKTISAEVDGTMAIPEPVREIDAIDRLKFRIADGAVVGYDTPEGLSPSHIDCTPTDNRLFTDLTTTMHFDCLVIYSDNK
jgi:hypothetical protein